MGTIESRGYRRGDCVVIATDRGTELAELMVVLPDGDERVPTGELLRVANENDSAGATDGGDKAAAVLAASQSPRRSPNNIAHREPIG